MEVILKLDVVPKDDAAATAGVLHLVAEMIYWNNANTQLKTSF